MSDNLKWKVNAPQLMKEILDHHGSGALVMPITIFRSVISEVAIRASELNDPKLNSLMCRLALYSISDPFDKDFDQELTTKIIYGVEP